MIQNSLRKKGTKAVTGTGTPPFKDTKSHLLTTTQIPEMLGCFLNLNKMKTKRLSNHMSQ